jgi:hypothetical protein
MDREKVVGLEAVFWLSEESILQFDMKMYGFTEILGLRETMLAAFIQLYHIDTVLRYGHCNIGC